MVKLGVDGVNKFGANVDIDIASEADIWDGGIPAESPTYVFPTQARIHNIVSSDAADDGKATGTLTLVSAIATDVAIVNGLTYTAVAGVKANNTEFSIDTSDTAAAADLADSINNDSRTGVTVPTAVVVATSALGVVTINVDGEIGNLVDISSPDATITASGATLEDVGTGAHTIFVDGIGSDGKVATETIILNGTTSIPTTKSYEAIPRMRVLTAGSGGANAGNITATAVTDATVTAKISIGKNQTLMAIYQVPIDADLMLSQYYGGPGKTTAANVDLMLLVKPPGEVFQVKHEIPANSQGNTNSVHEFKPPLKIKAGSQIRLRAAVSANNTVVYGGFDGDFSRPADL